MLLQVSPAKTPVSISTPHFTANGREAVEEVMWVMSGLDCAQSVIVRAIEDLLPILLLPIRLVHVRICTRRGPFQSRHDVADQIVLQLRSLINAVQSKSLGRHLLQVHS